MLRGFLFRRYIKFDTFTPAVERGLPVTRVISRMTLQEILARAVGDDLIMNASNVVDFEDDGKKVRFSTFLALDLISVQFVISNMQRRKLMMDFIGLLLRLRVKATWVRILEF